MSIVRSVRDLCRLTVKEETAYAKEDTLTGTTAGILYTADEGTESEYEDVPQCGSMVRADRFLKKMGFKPKFKFRPNAADLKKWIGWARYTSSAPSGTSLRIMVRIGPSEYLCWTGVRIDTLEVTASGIGEPIEVTATCVAAKMYKSTSVTEKNGAATATFSGASSFTFAETAGTYGQPTRWLTVPKAGSESMTDTSSWTVSLSRSLEAEPAQDPAGTSVALSAGLGSHATAWTVTAKVTARSIRSSAWDARRISGYTAGTLTVPVTGGTMTLSNAVLDVSGVSRSADAPYTEDLEFSCSDISM